MKIEISKETIARMEKNLDKAYSNFEEALRVENRRICNAEYCGLCRSLLCLGFEFTENEGKHCISYKTVG